MRWAKSYSIIDHEIFHRGYLMKLSHETLILYLFLVVVGDKEGRSFYSETTIMGILRLSEDELHQAKEQLLKENLIDYLCPYWWVKNITGGRCHERDKRKDIVSSGCDETKFSPDREANWVIAKKHIEDLSKKLGWK